MLLIDTGMAYGRGVLRGIVKYASLHGPWEFYRRVSFYREQGVRHKRTPNPSNLHVDGIIGYIYDEKEAKGLLATRLPAVAFPVKEKLAGIPNLFVDNITTANMVAEYLLGRGFRSFGFCGFDDMFWSRESGVSFGKRIAEAGFEVSFYKQPASQAKRLWSHEQAMICDWLLSLPKPVAIMACNDDRGQEVLEACKLAGLHVPEEVVVIGADNDETICDLTSPPLSSIAINTERAGYEAAELLDKLMRGEKATCRKILVHPTHIVTRQSTDIMAVNDCDIAAALNFIRQHSKELIQVNDVASAAALSRRSLERRFRKYLGYSVQNEIRRVHIEQIMRMLSSTNLPVSKIALSLGYSSADNISRSFRQKTGMTPMAYRKLYGGK